MNFATLSEDPVARIAYPSGQLIERPLAVLEDLRVPQEDQAGVDVFRKYLVGNRVIHHASGNVSLAHRGPGPLDHLSCENASDANLFAESNEKGIHPG